MDFRSIFRSIFQSIFRVQKKLLNRPQAYLPSSLRPAVMHELTRREVKTADVILAVTDRLLTPVLNFMLC